MRFDDKTRRVFVRTESGQEIHESDAPEYFLNRARDMFRELLAAREARPFGASKA